MCSAVMEGLGIAALLVCYYLSKMLCISPTTTEPTIWSHMTLTTI